ncbi:MAG: urea transporter [Rhodomicrobium sp.]
MNAVVLTLWGRLHNRFPSSIRAAQAKSGQQTGVKALDYLGRTIGGLLLLGSPRSGLLLAAAIGVEPQHLAGAMIGLLTAFGFLRMLEISDAYRAANVRANAILAGIAAAWLAAPVFVPVYVAVALIVLSAGAASMLAAALSRAMAGTPPPLSAAFALVFAVLLTLLPHWARAAVLSEQIWPYPAGFLGWTDSFLRSMGMIVFSPRPETGILVVCALMLWSSTLLLHGLAGWVAGIAISIVLANFGFQWLWLLSAHNGFVAAMLLGAVFHLPGRASLAASALAGLAAAILALFIQTGFSGTAWAFQPLPALVTVWVALLALSGRSVRHPLISNTQTELPPQQAWRVRRLADARFGERQPLIFVPLAGAAAITQGFGGSLSHRGLWQHGLDFEYPPQPGSAASTIFGAPVYCPAAGVVETVCWDIADNPLGTANYSQNWGNHIILRMDQGGWLMLAHLAQYSVSVVAGQRVRIGDAVAAVGSSGRSPVPHLHMHVQTGPWPGTPTMPFRLANYVMHTDSGELWVSSGVPEERTFVSAALPNPLTFHAATSLAPGSGLWRIGITGRLPPRYATIPRTERLVTALDPAGNHVICDSLGGRLLLHADFDALRVYDYREGGKLLRLLSLGLPVLPYRAAPGLRWGDYIDPPAVGLFEHLRDPLAPYANRHPVPVQLKCPKALEVTSGEILVETKVVARNAAEPLRVITRLAAVKGPFVLEAQFETGTMIAELIGFDASVVTAGTDSKPANASAAI